MKFEDLLKDMELVINAHFLQYSDETFKEGYREGVLRLFNYLKSECDDYPPRIRKATDEEEKQFIYKCECEDGSIFEGYTLDGILEYRGKIIPVYNDDAGQQQFIRYNNKDWGAGTYNLCPEFEFCDWLDDEIDYSDEDSDSQE